MSTVDDADLPPEVVEENGHRWERVDIDGDGYQWARPMDDDEYGWDVNEVSLVGTDVPVRVVSLQYLDGEWHVEGSETAGPDSYRPGFVETISAEFSYSTIDAKEAVKVVREFVDRLS